MNRIFKYIFSVIIILFCFVQCAKRGTPSGGPEDIAPPEVIRSTPENFSTNFDAEEIRIYFDEYVKIENAQQQVIISPPMDPRPEITPLGTANKYIRILIKDTLQENTTYAINFGRSIVDNNAGNQLAFYKYVFSTGNEIDSLSLSGTITDAMQREPDNFVSVMLYEVDSVFTDSAVFKRAPRYVTNTLDSASTFELTNLKEGRYQLVAVKDNNNNYRYDPESEKIAFIDDFVQIPTDAIYNLELFPEIPDFAVTRPSQISGQHLIFGFEGHLQIDNLQINSPQIPETSTSRIFKDPDTDTLHYFYKPKVETDSLIFHTSYNDTVETKILRIREMETDSLVISVNPTGILNFNEQLNLSANIPITIADETLFSIIDSDSIEVAFSTAFSALENQISLEFEKEENQSYTFRAFPGAIEGFFGSYNDSISSKFRTTNFSDYGNFRLRLQNLPESNIIVQLTTEKEEVKYEQMGENQSEFNFRNLVPGIYLLRIIFDENNNNRWDSGNFLRRAQPEKVIYYPEVLDIRANWDIDQTFILE